MKRLKVKNDFVFHKLFGEVKNKDILISFLNARTLASRSIGGWYL